MNRKDFDEIVSRRPGVTSTVTSRETGMVASIPNSASTGGRSSSSGKNEFNDILNTRPTSSANTQSSGVPSVQQTQPITHSYTAPKYDTSIDYDAEIARLQKEQADYAKNHLAEWDNNSFNLTNYDKTYKEYTNAIEQLNAAKWQAGKAKDYDNLSANADYAELSKKVDASLGSLYGLSIGKLFIGKGDNKYAYINDLNGKQTTALSSKDGTDAPLKKYSYMTQTEKDNYNYLYQSQGKKAAEEYLDYLEYQLDSRETEEYVKNLSEATSKNTGGGMVNRIVGNAASVPINLTSGIGLLSALTQETARSFSGEYKPINYNNAAMRPALATMAVRGGTAQFWNDKSGTINMDEKEHPILSRVFNGKGLGDVYQLGMSMVDSAATAAVGAATGIGAAGTILLGGSAGTQGMLDALSRGASDTQAITMGLYNGFFESLFEYVSLDKLINGDTANILKAFAVQGFVEGTEELSTSIANSIADMLIMADKSELKTAIGKYMADGLTEKDATKQALIDLGISMGWDFVGGLVSGGLMSGGRVALENQSLNRLYSEVYGNSGSEVQKLVSDTAKNAPDNRLASRLNSKLESDSNATVRGNQLRRLVNANQDALNAKDTTAIQNAVRERLKELGETGDVDRLAESIVKTSRGERVRVSDANAIEMSDAAKQTLREIRSEIDSDKTPEAEWTGRIGTEAIGNRGFNRLIELDKASEQFGDQAAAFKRIYNMDPSRNVDAFTSAYDYVKTVGQIRSASVESLLDNESINSVMSAEQIRLAYEIGTDSVDATTQAHIDELQKKVTPEKLKMIDTMRKNGTVRGDGVNIDDLKKIFNDQQNRAYKVLSRIAEATGINIVLYNSKTNDRGNFELDEGRFALDSNTIYIDINAGLANKSDIGSAGKYTMLRTFSHEFTHFLEKWSPEKYNEFRTAVFAAMNERLAADTSRKDHINTADDLVLEKMMTWNRAITEMNKSLPADKQQKLLDYDGASREVVAESMTEILPETSFMQDLYENHRSLFDDVVARIKEFIDNLKSFFSNVEADKKYEATLLREEVDGTMRYLDNIVKMYEDLAKSGVENYQAAMVESEATTETVEQTAERATAETISKAGIESVKGNGNQPMFSFRTMKQDVDYYMQDLKDAGLVGEGKAMTEAELQNLYSSINRVMNYVEANLNEIERSESFRNMDATNRPFMPYKDNSDPHYKMDLDFSTLCRKRLLTQAITERLQSSMKRALTPVEQVKIRNEIKKLQAEGKKLDVACALCYVEAARLKSPKVVNEFLNNKTASLKNYFSLKNSTFKNEVYNKRIGDWKEARGLPRNATKDMVKAAGYKVADLNKFAVEVRQNYWSWLKENQPETYAEQSRTIEIAESMDIKEFLTANSLAKMRTNMPDLYDAFISKVRSATRSKAQETDVPYARGDINQVGQSIIDQMNEESGFRHQSWSDFQAMHLLDSISAVIELATKKAKVHTYTKVADMVRFLGNTGMMINMSLIPNGNEGLNADGSLDFDPVEGIDYDTMLELRRQFPATAGNIAIGISDDQIRALLASPEIDYVIPYHTSGLNADMRRRMGIRAWRDYTKTQNESDLKKAPSLREWFDPVEAQSAADGYDYMVEASKKYLSICAERGITPKFPQFLAKNADGSYSLKDDAMNYWKLLVDRKMVNQITRGVIIQQAVVPRFDEDTMLDILSNEVNSQAAIDAREAEDYIVNKLLNEEGVFTKSDHEKARIIRDAAIRMAIENTAAEKNTAAQTDSGTQFEVRNIIGQSGTNYGLGVYLDSTALDSYATETDRRDRVRKFVTDMGGKSFTALDYNGDLVNVYVAERDETFVNEHGETKRINHDLLSYLRSDVKKTAILQIDEVLDAGDPEEPELAHHKHGVLDNYGNSKWDRWTVILQDKNMVVYRAAIHVANASDGRKILYDIYPIDQIDPPDEKNKRSRPGQGMAQQSASSTEDTALAATSAETITQTYAESQENSSTKQQNSFRDTNGLSSEEIENANREISRLRQTMIGTKYLDDYVGLSPNRMDSVIRDSVYKGNPDKAKSYIAWIDPTDFIYATTTRSETRQSIESEAGELDMAKLRGETQPIYLRVNMDTGEIVGHEGRHRLTALSNADVRRVSVIITSDEAIDNAQPISMMRLKGQRFGERKGTDFTAHHIMPISERYADNVRELFGSAKTQYSLRDSSSTAISNRDLLRQAATDIRHDETKYGKLTEGELASLFIFEARLRKLDAADQQRLDLLEQKRTILNGREAKELTGDERPKYRRVQNNLDTINAQRNRYNEDLLKVESQKVLQGVLKKARTIAEKEVRRQGTEKLQAYRAQRNETEATRKYRKQIADTAKTLSDWIKVNSDEKHVPAVLRKPLAQLLESIDFSSKRYLNGGELTNADRKFAANITAIKQLVDGQQAVLNGEDENKNSKAVDNLGAYLDLSVENRQFLNDLVDVIAQSGETTFTINRMNAEQLEAFSKFLKNLTTAIRQSNKMLANARYQDLPEMAQSSMKHMDSLGRAKDSAGRRISKFLQWENATPYYAFKRFGDAGKAIFDGFTRGWETFAKNAQEIIEFSEKTWTPKEVRAWRSEIHNITLEDGSKIRMTTAQIMELSQLLNRPQAVQHIEAGGIRIGNIDAGNGKVHQDTTHHHFSANDLSNVVGLLTDRQKEVATEMRKYMGQRGGEWGNEISMARFGYEFYTEGENYYTIKTDATGRPMSDTDNNSNSMFRLLNLSASKSLNPRANNALIVGDIFDTFSDHMADMAKLNALGLPLLDAIKWYNYTERTTNADGTIDQEGVKKAMESAFGTAAGKYFRTLLQDVNGVKEAGDRGGDAVSKLISNYKIAAVAANLRVALLQPTSYVRAQYILKPKYMAQAFLFKKNAYKDAMKYSGTAIWKSLGYYDTDIARSLRSQIENDDSFGDKLKEWSMSLAELGDKRTWGRLWVACKLQVKAENPDLAGEALNQRTADLFRETIYATQVMDSTLTRSEMMRGSTKWTKLTTAFMAEPTLSYNIAMDAASELELDKRKYNRAEAWRRNSGRIGRAFITYIASAAAAAIVESIADAFRDDDDYETLLEKIKQAFFGDKWYNGNLVEDLSIIGKIPVFKDFLDLLKEGKDDGGGMEMASAVSLLNAFKIWKETYQLSTGALKSATDATWNGKMTTYGKIYKTLQALSQLSGYPAANLTRDMVALWNTIIGSSTPELKLHTYDPGEKNSIKYAYLDGALTEEEATSALLEKGLAKDANDAYFIVSGWDTGDGKYTALKDAIKAGDSTAYAEALSDLTSHGVKKDTAYSQAKSYIRDLYVGTEKEEPSISKYQAISLLQSYAGAKKDEANDIVAGWSTEIETGFAYNELSDAYTSGKISYNEFVEYQITYGGKSRSDAIATAEKWKFIGTNEGWDNISEAAVRNYTDYCASAGISKRDYYEAWNAIKSIHGTDKDGDGTNDAYTTIDNKLTYIGRLNLTPAQKTALALASGISEKNINKRAPW